MDDLQPNCWIIEVNPKELITSLKAMAFVCESLGIMKGPSSLVTLADNGYALAKRLDVEFAHLQLNLPFEEHK